MIASYHAGIFAKTGVSLPKRSEELTDEILNYLGVKIEDESNNNRTETRKNSNASKTTSKPKRLA